MLQDFLCNIFLNSTQIFLAIRDFVWYYYRVKREKDLETGTLRNEYRKRKRYAGHADRRGLCI